MMLSTSTINKNVSQASHYFSEQDNYYSREEALQQSEWWGKGAEKMNLEGKADAKQFTLFLQGTLLNGEQLGTVIAGKINHRPGWDLTFSAPKSVSIMALVADDKRLLEAHRQAVKIALSHIEQSASQTRIKIKGKVTYENTQNLLGALYHHDLSRAKDPQLHTHCVIMNMTQRRDGKWRSLASSLGNYHEQASGVINGFIERIRHHNRYFSKIYETELAFRVKELGYNITNQTASGIFEIADVPKELIKNFSKRRQEIEAALEDKALSGGKAAAIATVLTRADKEQVDRQILFQEWQQEIIPFSVELNQIKETSFEPRVGTKAINDLKNTNEKAVAIIRNASKQLGVFQSIFSLEQIITHATQNAMLNRIDINTLLTATTSEISCGNLLSLNNEQGKTLLMAKSTLDDEKKLIHHLENNVTHDKVIKDDFLNSFLSNNQHIPENLHPHLKTIFNHDRMLLIEGSFNKNALIPPIMQISQTAGVEIAILSPSLVGGKQLAKEMKQKPHTIFDYIKSLFVDTTPQHYSVMQFLSAFDESHQGNMHPKKPALLLVDQAHLLSTHQKANLTEWSQLNNAKLLLFGHKEHLLPYQVSTSLQQLIDHGVKTIAEEISIAHPTQDDSSAIRTKFSTLSSRLIEVKNNEERYLAMAKQYSDLSQPSRATAWLTTYSQAISDKLNQLVHDQLAREDRFSKLITVKTLTPVYIQSDKLNQAVSYSKDQLIRFNQTYTSLGNSPGDYLRVICISKQSNRVILQKQHGERVIWRPDRIATAIFGKIEVFQETEHEFGVGESIVLSRSMKAQGLVKGERCTIDNIYQHQVKLRTNRGEIAIINLSKPYYRHFSYGYAATLHKITHEKPTTLIADLPANILPTHQRRLNQLISQSDNLWCYTNHIPTLALTLEKQPGNHLSAQEILSKSETVKAALNKIYDLVEKKLEKRIVDYDNHKNAYLTKAIDAIEYAKNQLAERQAGFSHKELMYIAMKYAVGDVTEKMLNEVVTAMDRSNLLTRGNKENGTFWTTAEAVKIERQIIALSRQDKGKMPLIADKYSIEQSLANKTLRPEQKKAIKTIVMSQDRVLSIQGRAGTGKTNMMASLEMILLTKEVVTESGYSLRGIAPTHKAVKELSARGIQSQTIDSFLLDSHQLQTSKQATDFSKTFLVVDEASMVSNKKMLAILKIAHEFNFSRVITMGDTYQHPAIEEGKPHDLIQQSLDKVISLNEIQRQKNPLLKEAALALYEKNVQKAFSILDCCIVESADDERKKSKKKIASYPNDSLSQQSAYQKRVKQLVNDYVSFLKQGEEVQIIAPSHEDRKSINQAVRSQLKEEGKLQGQTHYFSVFSSKDMTAAERSKATNFNENEIIKFNLSVGKHIQSGDYFQIKNIDKTHNLLILTKMKEVGKEVVWQIPRFSKNQPSRIEVFKTEYRELQIGDKIVWTRTNKKEALISAELAVVTQIADNRISIKNTDQRIKEFDASLPGYQHWDHAYALTTYSTQGGTYSTVLGFFESYRKNLMNLKTFLVTVTRAVNHLKIYTDNKKALQHRISGNHGNKLSSLEVIGEYPKQMRGHRSNQANLREETIENVAKNMLVKNRQDHQVLINAYRSTLGSQQHRSITPAKVKNNELERSL